MALQGMNAVSAPKESLLDNSANLRGRLSSILSRIDNIADRLHGPEPHDAAAQANTAEPIPTVARNVDTAHRLISDIETGLTRIESRL